MPSRSQPIQSWRTSAYARVVSQPPVVIPGRDLATTPDYSDEVAARIDQEVRGLVEHARAVARHIIESNRAVLDRLAAELVERETVDVERVSEIFASVEPYGGAGLGRPSAVAVSDTTPGRIPR